MGRIALISQDDALTKQMRSALLAGGHHVLVLPRVDDAAVARILQDRSDVLLVDTAGAVTNGTPVVRKLRAGRGLEELPVVAIVAEPDLPTFDPRGGLEDFVLASCSPAELGLRLRAVLARAGRAGGGQDVLRQGALTIDHTKYEVTLGVQVVDLTYKEYELLRFLALHAGRVFSRDALLSQIWGYDYYGGSRTVDVHIRRLRSKLETGGIEYIKTVRGVGYKFSELRPAEPPRRRVPERPGAPKPRRRTR